MFVVVALDEEGIDRGRQGRTVELEREVFGVFGVRLPRGLSPTFVDQVVRMSEGVVGLSGAMPGLVAARDAVLNAIAAMDGDMKRMARASDVRRLMTIPGVGQLTALAFTAAIDDPERIERSRDIGAYLGSCRADTSPAKATMSEASST